MATEQKFTFAISLSVLNHLGRNLYRSFATVLGEGISNSWDADAENVWIWINKDKNSLLIKDDGDGMTTSDFQDKFLKIGYSKRKERDKSLGKRPYIGRKGIGKLALLSCAKKVHVISKTKDTDYVGGVIDNSGLDKAIKEDLVPDNYSLGKIDMKVFGNHIQKHKKGTIIYFQGLNDGIKNTVEYLRKIVALYFRFSLLDDSFNIFINDEGVTLDDLKDLADQTEFLWNINNFQDPYIKKKLRKLKEPEIKILVEGNIKGFIASVVQPKNLKITNVDEKVTIDLFVNGRLREKDILKHIPTDRLAADYLYGQIHLDELDDKIDRFTSSREGVIEGDPKFLDLLEKIKSKLSGILDDWDSLRVKNKKEGDPENPRISRKERSSLGLYNAVSSDYSDLEGLGKEGVSDKKQHKNKVDQWVDELASDAQYNFTSYAECFISENLVRNHIKENKIKISTEATQEAKKWKDAEKLAKEKGNISIEIRRNPDDLRYLSMDDLANLVDKKDKANDACLARDAREYKPERDAVMHTSLLTDEAKKKLSSVFENIKGRVKKLLSKD